MTPIHYVANTRLPTEKANGYQTMKMAEALARLVRPLVLWAPVRFRSREMRGVRDPFAYYGVRRCFRIRMVPSIDLITPLGRSLPPLLGRAVFWLQGWSFSLCTALAALVLPGEVWYSRDVYFYYLFAPVARRLGKRVYLEAHHALPRLGPWRRLALGAGDGLVAITAGLAEDLVAWGAPPERVVVLPDGVDLAAFAGLPDRLEARRRLGLDAERPIALYAGHLYPWKGADTLIEAARRLRGADVVVVGGTEEDRRRLSAKAGPNVRFVGHLPPAEVPPWLAAADCLVLPNSAREAISRRYTSPLKLFEYLAAARPIVASDLPSLREVLADGRSALLVPPDDADALAAGIDRVLADPALGATLARGASDLAGEYTWDRRAARLAAFLRLDPPPR